jgi:hypothetical protein
MNKPHQATPRLPKFRCHKATGQGYVELNKRRIYLGRFDDPATAEKYHRTVAEWLSNDRRVPVAPAELTVAELSAAYMEHAKQYYRKTGSVYVTFLPAALPAVQRATRKKGAKTEPR